MAFLMGIALRLHKRGMVRDFHRLDSFSVPNDWLAERDAPASANPVSSLAARESDQRIQTALHSALRGMSAVDRLHLTSVYFEDRQPSDLDKERGEPIGTAKVRLHRARSRLRHLLERADRTEELCR